MADNKKTCIDCGILHCRLMEHEFPEFCPTLEMTDEFIDPKCNALGENMCNPILQAKYLNEQGTDLNVVIGLCVGHDSLFYKYSEAPCTTLVTKDRVLGHNPAVALYQADAYYKNKLFK